MQDQSSITLIGPLTLEVNLKAKRGPGMIGDSYLAKNRGLHFGGPLLKQIRCLMSLGHSANLIAYTGNDEHSQKIIDTIKQEGINANIQKLPGIATPISCNLFDGKSFSNFTSKIKDLSLWKLRLDATKITSSVIMIDPSIPSEIQIAIIKKYHKNATIVVRRPLDNNLEVFNAAKNLVVVLNEHDAFQLFLLMDKHFFHGYTALKLPLLENHQVVVESKKNLHILDEDNKALFIDFENIKTQSDITNEYFMATFLSALAGKQQLKSAVIWGLVGAIQNEHNLPVASIEIMKSVNQFKWQKVKPDDEINVK